MRKADGTESAFYVLDRNLRLVSATPTTLEIWGKTRGEIVGRALTDVFPQVEDGPVHRALVEAAQSFRPVSLRTMSEAFGKLVDVEIYPLGEELQVRFAPVKGDLVEE